MRSPCLFHAAQLPLCTSLALHNADPLASVSGGVKSITLPRPMNRQGGLSVPDFPNHPRVLICM